MNLYARLGDTQYFDVALTKQKRLKKLSHFPSSPALFTLQAINFNSCLSYPTSLWCWVCKAILQLVQTMPAVLDAAPNMLL